MRIASLFAALLLAFSGSLAAQRTCAAHEVLQQQIAENPLLQQRLQEIEEHTHAYEQQGVHERIVVTIPVVVNVVYNTTTENISDAQIQSQIAILNQDFRKLNADVSGVPAAFAGLAADCEINFCLAQRDPSGNATTGIRRQSTTKTSFSTNNAMKYTAQGGLDAWPRDQYLNLWVCDLGTSLLGYAQFPGGTAATDGVVIHYKYFGNIGTATAPFNKGRTATHEVGHWLNLYHIWGDDSGACTGSDQVADTPNQASEHYGCPTFPQVSCSNGANGDMFMNYMDYTDDACMFMFSAGQKARMQALFSTGGARASLLNSLGCTPPSGGGTCAVPSGLSSGSITTTSATVSWGAVSGASSYTLQYKTAAATTWTTVSGITTTSRSLTGLTAATTYNYKVLAVCSSGSSAYSTAASFTTSSASTCTDSYESNETRNAAKTIPVNTDITAKIGTSSDKDYFKFANTSTNKNIKVELTNLPADYDLKLYRSSTLLGTSQNTGTESEVLIFNNATVSTAYVAYVYGYNSAYNANACYTLRASISSAPWALRTDGSYDGESEEIELPVVFENAGFGMFPNPAKDQLTVEVPMENDGDVQIAIMDASGRITVQEHFTLGKGNNQANFDLSRLNAGMYLVQVRNGESVHTRKLVVQQ